MLVTATGTAFHAESDPGASRRAPPAAKNDDQHRRRRHPGGREVRRERDEQRRQERRGLARQREQAEELAGIVGRREPHEQAARGRLQGPGHEADERARSRDRSAPAGSRRGRRLAPRRDRDTKKSTRSGASDTMPRQHEEEHRERAEHHGACRRCGRRAGRPRAAPNVPAMVSRMPKMPSSDGLPAEHAGPVDAAEREQRHEPVLVDHVGEKEAHHGLVPARLGGASSRATRGRRGPPRASGFDAARRIGREQEHAASRRRRTTAPRAARRSGRPRGPRRRARRPAARPSSVRPVRGSAARKPSVSGERHEAAGIAGRPAGAGEPAQALRRHESRHHGVVEHGRELRPDGGRACRRQARWRPRAAAPGAANQSAPSADHEEGPEGGDPRLLGPGGVGDGAEHRRGSAMHRPAAAVA